MKTKITSRPIAKLTACASLALACASLAQAQTTFTFENPPFVSGPIAGQDGWATSGVSDNMTVRTDAELQAQLTSSGFNPANPVHGGSQAFVVSGYGSSSTSTHTLPGIADYSTVVIDLWARPLTPRYDTSATNLGNVFMTVNSATGTRAVAFRFGFDAATTSTHIDYAEATSAIWRSTGVPWTSNTWYHITLTVDLAAQSYDFAVDGTKLNTSPISFYQGNVVNALGQILFFRGTSQAGMIVDDVTVNSTAPTGPPTRLASTNPYGFKVRISDLVLLTPNTNTITLKLDGQSITPTAISQTGNIGVGDNSGLTTVIFDSPSVIMPSLTTHTVEIHYEVAGSAAVNKTFTFTVAPVNGTLDRAHHYLGQFRGTGVKYSPPGAGRTGASADFAIDMGNLPAATAKVLADDFELLTALRSAASSDTLSVSLWSKRRAFTNSSSVVWINSPSAPNSGRAFQLHCPYWDTNAYFDTGGAVEGPTRLKQDLSSLGGIEFWSGWHHLVAIKNGGAKQVWIDGQVVANQDAGAADLTGYIDLNSFVMGAGAADNLAINGLIDDVAVFASGLSPAEVASLYTGTAPSSVKPESLVAWWDFNDYPNLRATRQGDQIIVTFNQTLQSATNVAGPYIDLPNATSPYTNTTAPGTMFFYRARR